MFQATLVIQNPSGLHARPASRLTQLCQKFSSEILIKTGSKTIQPKSIVSLLASGIRAGSEIILEITGEDEEEAGARIIELINSFDE